MCLADSLRENVYIHMKQVCFFSEGFNTYTLSCPLKKEPWSVFLTHITLLTFPPQQFPLSWIGQHTHKPFHMEAKNKVKVRKWSRKIMFENISVLVLSMYFSHIAWQNWDYWPHCRYSKNTPHWSGQTSLLSAKSHLFRPSTLKINWKSKQKKTKGLGVEHFRLRVIFGELWLSNDLDLTCRKKRNHSTHNVSASSWL